MERQIGEQFDFLDVTLEVAEWEEDCKGCYLFGKHICGYDIIANFLGSCASSVRKDKKDVIFKKVE